MRTGSIVAVEAGVDMNKLWDKCEKPQAAAQC